MATILIECPPGSDVLDDEQIPGKRRRVCSSSSVNGEEPTTRKGFRSGVCTKSSAQHAASEDRVVDGVSVGKHGVYMFAVIDGHGGAQCSSFLSEALPRQVQREASKRSLDKLDRSLLDEGWSTVLVESFRHVADEWDTVVGTPVSGAVATLMLVSRRACLIAHAGDCKVVASLPGYSCVELTRDHRCTDPDEVVRVKEAGGRVENSRVAGRLLPTRAFGDLDVRRDANGTVLNCVAPEPDICYHSVDVDESMNFVIVATDGLFDVVSSPRAARIVRESLAVDGCPTSAARNLIQAASRRSRDDISVVVLVFD